MNHITRLSTAAIAGLSALALAACGSSSSSNSSSSSPASQAAAAPSSVAPTTAAAASKPATGSGDVTAGGANTITITGESGATYKFPAGSCLGDRSASGKLTLVANTQNGDVTVALSFDGSGKFNILLTTGVNDSSNSAIWSGEAAVGAAASRTGDTITFADVPIAQLTPGHAAKASGSLNCESTAALL